MHYCVSTSPRLSSLVPAVPLAGCWAALGSLWRVETIAQDIWGAPGTTLSLKAGLEELPGTSSCKNLNKRKKEENRQKEKQMWKGKFELDMYVLS